MLGPVSEAWVPSRGYLRECEEFQAILLILFQSDGGVNPHGRSLHLAGRTHVYSGCLPSLPVPPLLQDTHRPTITVGREEAQSTHAFLPQLIHLQRGLLPDTRRPLVLSLTATERRGSSCTLQRKRAAINDRKWTRRAGRDATGLGGGVRSVLVSDDE